MRDGRDPNMKRSGDIWMRRIDLKAESFFWLVPALLALPLFMGVAFAEEANVANALQAVSTSMIVWFPCFALIAAFRGRFVPIHAALATALYTAYDSLRVREHLYDVLNPVLDFSGNPNWITMVVMLGALIALLGATLLRPTLFRVVTLVAFSAQVVTLVLFHLVTVTGPMSIAHNAEVGFVEQIVARTGSTEVLCGVQERLCWEGTPADLINTLQVEVKNASGIVRYLRDEADGAGHLFTWTEAAFASTADEAMRHISVRRMDETSFAVMINEQAPTQAFSAMKIAFSVLAGAFQQTWMTLVLLILWRHKNYRLKSWKWQLMKARN